MAHAAAHLKKARELEQHQEYRALQKARERRRRHRERAERRRQVFIHSLCHVSSLPFRFHAPVDLRLHCKHWCGGIVDEWAVGGKHRCGLWLTMHGAEAAVLSDDLSCRMREVDSGELDDRCGKGSSLEGGHMLVWNISQ